MQIRLHYLTLTSDENEKGLLMEIGQKNGGFFQYNFTLRRYKDHFRKNSFLLFRLPPPLVTRQNCGLCHCSKLADTYPRCRGVGN